MEDVIVEYKHCLEYIAQQIDNFKITATKVSNARYHHNTKYHLTSSIIEHGILHLRDLNAIGIQEYSDEFLNLMSDTTSHINGDDGISLSVAGLDDLNQKEEEYDPFSEKQVDILIDSDIKAFRNSTNYGNEFISFESIPREKFKAIDIRLLKLINKSIKSDDIDLIKNIVRKYNSLRRIALSMCIYNLDIPLREMSDEEYTLDIEALSKSKRLKLE